MRSEQPAVQPHRHPVVDRLEPDDPVLLARGHLGPEGAHGKREVPPVPADRPRHAWAREVPRVVRVRNRRGRPADGRGAGPPLLAEPRVGGVGAIQPLAPQEVAAGLAVPVERPGRGRRRAEGGRLCSRQRRGAQQEHERHENEPPRAHARLWCRGGLWCFFGLGLGLGLTILTTSTAWPRLPVRSVATPVIV